MFALVAGTGGWQRLIRAMTIGLAFVVVVAAYGGYYWIKAGEVGFSRGDAYLLYGRAATIVDCRGFDLPEHERVLCPKDLSESGWGPTSTWTTAPTRGESCYPPAVADTVLRDLPPPVCLYINRWIS